MNLTFGAFLCCCFLVGTSLGARDPLSAAVASVGVVLLLMAGV